MSTTLPSRPTAVPKPAESKKNKLREYLAEHSPTIIDEAIWQDLIQKLAPVSESYLRSLLRDGDIPLAPLVEGVRQDTLEHLENTLVALEQEYARGDRSLSGRVRKLVIEAKNHAQWSLKSPRTTADGRTFKTEALLWMRTWLENPAAFPVWVRLRKQKLG